MGLGGIAVIGHGESGKDRFAHQFARAAGLRLGKSVSLHMAPHVSRLLGLSVEEAYHLRRENREQWAEVIDDYREGDPARCIREILEEGDVVVGVRRRHEFEAARRQRLLRLVIWIERPDRPKDPTMQLTVEDADIVIMNNQSLAGLLHRARRLGALFYDKRK